MKLTRGYAYLHHGYVRALDRDQAALPLAEFQVNQLAPDDLDGPQDCHHAACDELD